MSGDTQHPSLETRTCTVCAHARTNNEWMKCHTAGCPGWDEFMATQTNDAERRFCPACKLNVTRMQYFGCRTFECGQQESWENMDPAHANAANKPYFSPPPATNMFCQNCQKNVTMQDYEDCNMHTCKHLDQSGPSEADVAEPAPTPPKYERFPHALKRQHMEHPAPSCPQCGSDLMFDDEWQLVSPNKALRTAMCEHTHIICEVWTMTNLLTETEMEEQFPIKEDGNNDSK